MAEIPRRTLGRTGLEVSTLGYGAMELRGGQTGPALSDDDAATLLNMLLDQGVNFIDTSIDYGRSEDVIGDTIAHRTRRVRPRVEVRLCARRTPGLRPRAHRREHPRRRGSEPPPAEDRPP